MAATRVMLVDDSALIRRLLGKVLATDPGIVVAGQAANGRLALDQMEKVKPDLVILDIEMPEMDGLETLAHMKHDWPDVPVIMFSTLTERGASATLEALTRGADDYVAKPSNTGSFDATAAQITEVLIPKIKGLVERYSSRPPSRSRSRRAGAAKPAFTPSLSGHQPGKVRLSTPRRSGLFKPQVVVIGVSTGGPEALQKVIPQLPGDLPVPVLVTQHMPPIFTRLLAERLDAVSKVRVGEAESGITPKPGEVWFAPGGKHLLLQKTAIGAFRLVLDDGPPVQSCKPAVDPMFASVVKACGQDVLAVMMTGMGNDGHHGSEAVRDAGGQVICQDEDTSVVWGMPGVVARAGLAEKILPLSGLAPAIVEAVQLSRGSRPARAGTASSTSPISARS